MVSFDLAESMLLVPSSSEEIDLARGDVESALSFHEARIQGIAGCTGQGQVEAWSCEKQKKVIWARLDEQFLVGHIGPTSLLFLPDLHTEVERS